MAEHTISQMDSVNQKRLEELVLEYKAALIGISNIENVLQPDIKAGIKATQEFVSATMNALLPETELFVVMLDSKIADAQAELIHHLNVFYLCLTLGSGMGLSRAQLCELGAAAILHDIGKRKIPAKLLSKHPPFTPAEKQLLERHPQYAVEILAADNSISPKVIEAIYQHHEKCNGTGYPLKRTTPNISLFAKIIAVANTYDNLCNRYYLKRLLTPHESISYLYTRLGEELSMDIIKTFIKTVGVYPPGGLVELTDGSMGVVIATNKAQSTRPSIILYSKTTPREESRLVNLSDVEGLHIVRSIHPTEASEEVVSHLQQGERLCLFLGSLTVKNVAEKSAPTAVAESENVPAPYERRVILRAKPTQNSGLSVFFQGAEVNVVDISVGGACISESQAFALNAQDAVTVTIRVDNKEFDVKSTVTRMWSSQEDNGLEYFAALQFLSNSAMREALLGKKVLSLEKENNPAAFNRRMSFRVKPMPHSGLSVYYQEAELNIVDISVGGICISNSQSLPLTSQETVMLILNIDGKQFDVKSTVIRTWSSQAGSSMHFFASIQFLSHSATREALLGNKIMQLERERFLNKID